jgi:hypothetical protein
MDPADFDKEFARFQAGARCWPRPPLKTLLWRPGSQPLWTPRYLTRLPPSSRHKKPHEPTRCGPTVARTVPGAVDAWCCTCMAAGS